MTVRVKICGLKTAEDAHVALEAGADFLGCVFFEPSPRHVSPDQAAEVFDMIGELDAKRVGLFVDPDEACLDQVLAHVRLDIVQLHGHETPQRVEEVRQTYGVEVMKALPIETPKDVDTARTYDGVADYLLFDAKPPKGATRPGGNAIAFDWTLLKATDWSVPWMLAGGLRAGNVCEAVLQSGAAIVDVSSGVESEKGVKSKDMIRRFIENVKSIR